MTTKLASRAELVNRSFRRGIVTGAAAGFILCALIAVLTIIEWKKADDGNPGGPVGLLVHVGYMMSFPFGIAYVIAGTCIFALIGGALGIVTSKVSYRISR